MSPFIAFSWLYVRQEKYAYTAPYTSPNSIGLVTR